VDPYSLSVIGLFAFLLVCSSFFSATETAFSSVNRIKLKHLIQEGNRKAALILEITEKYDQFLSTVLIGNNIVNILASSIATALFVGFFGNTGITIATAATTVLVLIFGEISPKTLAKEAPEKFAVAFVYPIRLLMFLFTPVNYLSAKWKQTIIKLFHIRSDNTVTEAELLTFVGEVREVGGINKGEEHMIRTVIEFDDLTANDILTPRVDLVAVSMTDTIENIETCFYETGYSRLPVYDGSIDNIIGVILLKDFVHKMTKNHAPLNSVIMPVLLVNKTIKISRLLKTLQEKKTHIAVALDEYGGTIGIVTLEDIVEELVGEIWDEHEKAMENIVALDHGSYRIRGNTPLKDFYETLGLEEKYVPSNASTVGGWATEHIGEIPREGYCFTFTNFSITVVKLYHNRIMELMATPSNNRLV
jgi:CBS domain containing-hemolysin-like protein